MKKTKRIACFFTAGYTELNAMKAFMKKANGRVDYIQLCPTGPRRSKDAIKNRHTDTIHSQQNGLTGDALIEFVTDFVEKKRFLEERYDAILIEDDKDDRFLALQEDGTARIDQEAWEIFKKNVTKRIRDKCPGIPIIFFYAAPEVEAWFLSDWDNGFGSIYKDVLTKEQNDYFSVRFRKFVNNSILTSRYKSSIEAYGYFGGKYRKLSEQLQSALEKTDFLEGHGSETQYPAIRYSKRIQGEDMLRQINPGTILHTCSFYFKEGFLALKRV